MIDNTLVLDHMAQVCHDTSRDHGFWDHEEVDLLQYHPLGDRKSKGANPSIYPEKIALMHSELSEALEALRDNDRDQEEEELADVVIRLLDYAHARGFSMSRAVSAKMEKNKSRPRLHGRAF